MIGVVGMPPLLPHLAHRTEYLFSTWVVSTRLCVSAAAFPPSFLSWFAHPIVVTVAAIVDPYVDTSLIPT